MKLHSDFIAQRLRQMTADVVAVALIAVSVATGIAVFSTVNQLARFGVQMQTAGTDFRTSMTDVGTRLGGLELRSVGIRAR